MEKESLYIFKLDDQGNKIKFPNPNIPAKIGEYTYSAQRMAGTPTLTATLNYPSCLDDLWTGEEFVEFRGEKYYVDQVPTSSKDNKSIMYKHELQFVSERIVLENVYFMDVVTAGADTYHSNSTSVKFMGDINEFVGRLNASMTKSGIGYSVVIDDDITSDSKLVSLDNVYIADALQSIYTIYDLPYYFVGKVCHIGYTEHVVSTPFEYRKGLVSIKKTNANYKIVNRVTGVGSSDNIPFYYPNDDETGTIERSQNLMPTIYRQSGGENRFYNALNNTYKIPGTNDYYSFKNTYSSKKVKEIKVDFSDIKPTIEDVTNASGQLFGEIADIAFDANDSDKLGTGTGNNVFNGTDEYVHSYFYIKLHIYNGDYGFNLFEQGLEGGTAVINMTTGNCAACEFEIGVTYKDSEPKRAFNPVLVDANGNLPAGDFEQKVTSDTSQYVDSQQNTSTNEVWIAVKKDNTSFGVVMPNATNNYKPSVGDKFVITGIKMPKPLVLAAEKRLEEALIKYMSENNDEKFTFSVNFSRVFLADNTYLWDILNENARIYIKYNNREYLMYVNSFTCKADKNCLYDISIELTDKLSANVSALRSTISEIAGDIIGNTSGGFGAFDIISKTSQYYLRKDIDDTARGNILFDKKIRSSIFIDGFEGKGWEIKANGAAIFESTNVRSNLFVGNKIGSPSFSPGLAGWGTEVDIPSATITTDNLYLRKNFFANTITYSQVYAVGGSQVVSDVNKIESVERLSDRWRCYIDKMDGLMKVHLRVGDGARIRSDIGVSLIKSLFGRVIEIGSTYFDIAYPMLDGIGEPAPGDFVTRWGNNVDTSRQGLIYSTTSDTGAPFTSVYDGITDITTQDKLKVQFGNISNIRLKNGRQLYGYGAYLNGIWIENSQIFLDNGDTIEQNFFAMNGKFESQIEAIKNDMSVESGNILVNSSFSRDLKYWTLSNDVHFINTPTGYLWMDGYFYVEKNKVADIYQDGGKNVLRIKDTSISQLNGVINIPERKEVSENGYIYSFALYYKVLRPGTLSVGFTGTDLYIEQELEVSEDYEKLSKVAHWDEKGDFMLKFTGGEILIYGVSLFNDALADAQVYLQTQINQNKEAIKLMATKEYVDGETGKIYIKYDAELKVQNDLIGATVIKIDNINNRIDTAGWITATEGNTLFAAKSLEDGNKIIAYINQSATTTTISSSRINLIGAVSFQMFDTSLQNTVNSKLESGDMGSLAWKDSVASSDLAASLATDIANKVNTDALRGYAFNNGATISKSDLADALQTEITSKLTGSSETSGNKLASVIINGQTLIAGGYIQSNFIKADEIFTTTLLANTIKASGLNINDKFIVDKEGFVDMQGKFTASYNGNKIIINPSSEGAKITGIDSNGRTVMNIGFSYYEGVNAPLIEMTYYNSSGQEMGSTRIAPDGASFRSRLNTGGMSTMTIGRSSKGLGMTINATFPTYAQASYGDLYVDGDDVVRIRQEW